MNELIEITKDAVKFDRTHARKTFHRLEKALLHDLQTFQMRAFSVNQFIDGRLKFPFTRVIQHLQNIRTNEFAQIGQRVHIRFEITITTGILRAKDR